MIVFDLACGCGYTFEGWFQDRQDFECQQTASFLVCPVCGSTEIRKVLSPIRTQLSRREGCDTANKKAEKTASPESVSPAITIFRPLYSRGLWLPVTMTPLLLLKKCVAK